MTFKCNMEEIEAVQWTGDNETEVENFFIENCNTTSFFKSKNEYVVATENTILSLPIDSFFVNVSPINRKFLIVPSDVFHFLWK